MTSRTDIPGPTAADHAGRFESCGAEEAAQLVFQLRHEPRLRRGADALDVGLTADALDDIGIVLLVLPLHPILEDPKRRKLL